MKWDLIEPALLSFSKVPLRKFTQHEAIQLLHLHTGKSSASQRSLVPRNREECVRKPVEHGVASTQFRSAFVLATTTNCSAVVFYDYPIIYVMPAVLDHLSLEEVEGIWKGCCFYSASFYRSYLHFPRLILEESVCLLIFGKLINNIEKIRTDNGMTIIHCTPVKLKYDTRLNRTHCRCSSSMLCMVGLHNLTSLNTNLVNGTIITSFYQILNEFTCLQMVQKV